MIEELSKTGIRRDIQKLRGDRFCVEPGYPWVARRKVMNTEREPGEPVTILLFDRQIHAPSNTRYTRVVRRLETHQAVQDLGTIELAFDPAIQRLVVHGVSVFRAGTLTNHANESAFELLQREATLEQDVLTGAVTALLLLKDIRVGDVLDIEFSVISDSGLFGEHYWHSETVENVHPVGRQWLSWIERDGQDLFIREAPGFGTFEKETNDHGTVRNWKFEHTPVVRLEPDLPASYRPFAEIGITTFPGWNAVVDLFLAPWSAEPSDRSGLDMELAALRNRFSDDAGDGITAATNLVRHQIRYLGYSPGILGLVPADPGMVWQRRFGDCKEKSRLLCWLLRELGVEADPVLVHSFWGGGLHEFPPSPGVFDHVVVRVRHGGDVLWIDPTDVARQGAVTQWKSLPFHFGLPLVPDSDQLVAIPAEPKGTSGLEVEETVLVDSKSRGANIMVSHTYRGRDADMMRHAMDSRGRSALSEYLTEQVKLTRRDAQPSDELEVTDDPTANILVMKRKFRCEELLAESPNGDAAIVFIVPHSVPQRVTGVSTTERRHPLGIQHPVDVKHTIRLNSPDPKNCRIPAQIVNNEFFKFSFITTSNRTESIHSFVFNTLSDQVPPSKIRSYSKDLAKVAEALDWHIRFPPRRRPQFRSYPSADPRSW